MQQEFKKNAILFSINAYHWERIDEIAVNRIEWTRVVIRGSTNRRQIYRLRQKFKNSFKKRTKKLRESEMVMRRERSGTNQIWHLDEAFEARVVLDVQAVELDAIGPRVSARGLEKVLDLVAVDIETQHLVRRLRHELFAEVGANEATSSDHAYRQRLDWFPVQIYPRRHFSLFEAFLCCWFLCFLCTERAEFVRERERERERNLDWKEGKDVKRYLKGKERAEREGGCVSVSGCDSSSLLSQPKLTGDWIFFFGTLSRVSMICVLALFLATLRCEFFF